MLLPPDVGNRTTRVLGDEPVVQHPRTQQAVVCTGYQLGRATAKLADRRRDPRTTQPLVNMRKQLVVHFHIQPLVRAGTRDLRPAHERLRAGV